MCGDSGSGSSAFKHGFIGFIIGAAVGAVAALFLTTRTGEELRSEVKKAIIDLREKVEEKSSKIKNLTREKYAEIVHNVVEAYNKAKEFTEKEVELIKKILVEQKEAEQE
ncbi:MAG: hypothetical protein FJW66_02125 [Actinobacteria bacterium]|nr:hypothetical protein [Actinomycetota bacterium]